MLEKLKCIPEILSLIDEKLGIRKFCQYLLIGAVIYGIFNFKTIVKDIIEIHNLIQTELHSLMMKKRDELHTLLLPMLNEFRSVLRADRILYFEYHNSKENLVGIPFKYVDLVMSSKRYGIADLNYSLYRDINSGLITDLYDGLCRKKIIFNKGLTDLEFINNYSSVYEILEIDGSKQWVFINLSGITMPLGFIVVEWYDEEPNRNWAEIKTICGDYEPRINALIVSKSK